MPKKRVFKRKHNFREGGSIFVIAGQSRYYLKDEDLLFRIY